MWVGTYCGGHEWKNTAYLYIVLVWLSIMVFFLSGSMKFWTYGDPLGYWLGQVYLQNDSKLTCRAESWKETEF